MAKESEKRRNVGKNGVVRITNVDIAKFGSHGDWFYITFKRVTVRKLTPCKRIANYTVTPSTSITPKATKHEFMKHYNDNNVTKPQKRPTLY